MKKVDLINLKIQQMQAKPKSVELDLTKNPRLAGPHSKKCKFTKTEDAKLYNLVQVYGENDWRSIADQMPYRTPRQCRERWTNYVNPDLNKKPWSMSEDMCLLSKHRDFGNKWKIIQKFFPGRSKNDIKQRIKHLEAENIIYQKHMQSHVPILSRSSSSPSCEDLCPDAQAMRTYCEITSYIPQPKPEPTTFAFPPVMTPIQIQEEVPSPQKQRLYLMDVQDLWPATIHLPVLNIH